MCDTCGCSDPNNRVIIRKPGEKEEHLHTHADGTTHSHDHHHEHEHSHEHHHHDHGHPHEHHSHDHSSRQIEVEQDVLQQNNLKAEQNRGFFEAKGITAFNLVSSPGSGKTSLLERTIKELGKELTFSIIEGDQQTTNDADRIQSAGAPVIQINTGNGCHLDADMVNQAAKKLEIADHSILFIENVGNLVCPALFDLGENKRIVIMSVTEGDDKPLKYPTMFETADLCIINKTDLLPYVDFDTEKSKEYARRVNPELEFIELSVRTGEGMEKWYQWLRR